MRRVSRSTFRYRIVRRAFHEYCEVSVTCTYRIGRLRIPLGCAPTMRMDWSPTAKRPRRHHRSCSRRVRMSGAPRAFLTRHRSAAESRPIGALDDRLPDNS